MIHKSQVSTLPDRARESTPPGARDGILPYHAEYGPELLASEVEEWRTKLGLACLPKESPAIFLPLYLAAVVLGLASILGPLAPFALAGWYAWTRWIT